MKMPWKIKTNPIAQTYAKPADKADAFIDFINHTTYFHSLCHTNKIVSFFLL